MLDQEMNWSYILLFKCNPRPLSSDSWYQDCRISKTILWPEGAREVGKLKVHSVPLSSTSSPFEPFASQHNLLFKPNTTRDHFLDSLKPDFGIWKSPYSFFTVRKPAMCFAAPQNGGPGLGFRFPKPLKSDVRCWHVISPGRAVPFS